MLAASDSRMPSGPAGESVSGKSLGAGPPRNSSIRLPAIVAPQIAAAALTATGSPRSSSASAAISQGPSDGGRVAARAGSVAPESTNANSNCAGKGKARRPKAGTKITLGTSRKLARSQRSGSTPLRPSSTRIGASHSGAFSTLTGTPCVIACARMTLNPEAVGLESSEHTLRFDWKTLALYALGIGAKRGELDYLYEERGPKVFPTFAVVPGYPLLFELLGRSGGSLTQVVHATQSVRMHAPLPRYGELATRGKITGLYDMKKFAQMVFETRTQCEGQLVFETEWSMFFLGEGGFGGPRPPKGSVPKIPSDAQPVFEFEEVVSPEQALLYRLSGDFNPLHADPAFAAQVGFSEGPILHGLAT